MELFNKSGALLASGLVMVGALIACQAKEDSVPPPQVIEAAAQALSVNGGAAAERRLREWAEQGSVVARRELGLFYQGKQARRAEAVKLLEQAALAGDSEAAFQLAELYRGGQPFNAQAAEKAHPWYLQAARHSHPKAALTLASLASSGKGAARDEEEAAKWADIAASLKAGSSSAAHSWSGY
ncbi:hypothetical protein [Massilia sp. BJB1822]|uniref:hypothetical protein n=1 Tax=Massilia sp. BJB1822 TaxID=2744470 RepID=UPI0015937B82|nr:hypothetical protein [Massilia sp. BJB1822]NVD98068.1 hypothetical protein [Massilia sp. BJB1822]